MLADWQVSNGPDTTPSPCLPLGCRFSPFLRTRICPRSRWRQAKVSQQLLHIKCLSIYCTYPKRTIHNLNGKLTRFNGKGCC
eukprot:7503344-Pyramimonas_sp.AAC.1